MNPNELNQQRSVDEKNDTSGLCHQYNDCHFNVNFVCDNLNSILSNVNVIEFELDTVALSASVVGVINKQKKKKVLKYFKDVKKLYSRCSGKYILLFDVYKQYPPHFLFEKSEIDCIEIMAYEVAIISAMVTAHCTARECHSLERELTQFVENGVFSYEKLLAYFTEFLRRRAIGFLSWLRNVKKYSHAQETELFDHLGKLNFFPNDKPIVARDNHDYQTLLPSMI